MSTTAFPLPARARREASARRWWRAVTRGSTVDPAWARPAIIALLAATAAAYLWNLTASGDANSFYAAAVQAGTHSWKAFFFGSVDSSSFITVDKPPASLWVMALSGRIFGFSSASMLVPQVVEGVVAVGLLAAAIKRWFGPAAGILAGAALGLTPVAALMFRFNNPDALLVCLLVAAAYCLVRAIEDASTRWMVDVGTLIGVAFLAKMMQAFLVVPGFALVYLLAAPTGLRRRITQLLAGAGALILSAGWWVAIVALLPTASRPMIDGSSTNNIFNLIMGYNGLGRIFGSSGPGGAGGPGGGGGPNFSGQAGMLRLFNDLMGAQASWLLPAAVVALGVILWLTRRSPRTDRVRAAAVLWGSWLLVSAAVFSLSTGVIHTYYTVALAPAIAALGAIAASELWRRRGQRSARFVLAGMILLTAGWSIILLGRTPNWNPWLRPLIGAGALVAVGALLAHAHPRHGPRLGRLAAALAVVACLVAPAAYAAQTITTAHTGSTPSAGPATTGRGFGGMAGAARPGAGARGLHGSRPGSGAMGGSPPGGGAMGGSPQQDGNSVSSALVRELKAGGSRYRWVAATSGSESAASLELATGGEPVMAIGGFNNQGGNLSLAQFQRYVSAREIHFYIPAAGGMRGGAGGMRGGPGGGSTSTITQWVEQHFRSETVGGQTIYDLTQPKG